MRCKVVTPREMRDVFRAEVRPFAFAYRARIQAPEAPTPAHSEGEIPVVATPASQEFRFRPLAWPKMN